MARLVMRCMSGLGLSACGRYGEAQRGDASTPGDAAGRNVTAVILDSADQVHIAYGPTFAVEIEGDAA